MPTIPQLPTNNTPPAGSMFPYWNPFQLTTQQTALAGLLGTNLAAISGLTGTAGTLVTNGSGTWTVSTSSRIVLPYGTTLVLDGSAGRVFDVTLTGNTVFSAANLRDGEVLRVIVAQDSVGSHTVTWPAGTVWAGAAAPVLSTAANAIDQATFLNRGGVLLGQFAKGFG